MIQDPLGAYVIYQSKKLNKRTHRSDGQDDQTDTIQLIMQHHKHNH